MTEQLNNKLPYCQQGPLTCSLHSNASPLCLPQTCRHICFRVLGLTAAFPLFQTVSSHSLPVIHVSSQMSLSQGGKRSSKIRRNFQYSSHQPAVFSLKSLLSNTLSVFSCTCIFSSLLFALPASQQWT